MMRIVHAAIAVLLALMAARNVFLLKGMPQSSDATLSYTMAAFFLAPLTAIIVIIHAAIRWRRRGKPWGWLEIMACICELVAISGIIATFMV